ncbi:MAG: Ig-like domain-containing protein [Bryobacteraceae bacterium]|nr:Ig-like domain-containing protein [Bryobacteraceae bacterium]
MYLVLLFLTAALAAAADRFVAPFPTGQPAGDGSVQRPWDLATALRATSPVVQPGDTVYLRRGNYRPVDADTFAAAVSGTAAAPIAFRAATGEFPHIDGGFEVTGSWLVIRDLEFSGSLTKRRTDIIGPWPDNLVTPSGVAVFAPNVKVINCVIHDLQEGVDGWADASDVEIYGNLIFYNGWNGPDRGHGHGIYSQNRSGKKWIHDNLIYQNFAQGMQLYGTSETFLNGFDVRGNIVFQNGSPSGEFTRNILLGGTAAMNDPVLSDNFTYYPVVSPQGGSNGLGYTTSGLPCSNAQVEGNYFVSASTSLALVKCSIASLRNNTFVGPVTGFTPASWPENTYLAATQRPPSPKIVVRPNRYEAGRAHIAVFNWPLLSAVNVDVSGIGLQPGDDYELRSAQDPWSDVVRGTYSGVPIRVAMTGRTVARPRGWTAPASTFPEFGAFLIRKRPSLPGGVAPGVPADLSAAVVSATQIRLSWTDVPDASRYRVYRNGLLVDVLAANSWEDGDLSSNTSYSYAVRTEEAGGLLSAPSNVVTARTQAVSAPLPGTSYLSDWGFVRMSNGLGVAQKDKANNGSPLRILGSGYARGLGVHAWSANSFRLAGQCTSFTAKVGLDDSSRPGGQISFKVMGDGVELFNSGTLDNTSPLRDVNVNLAGKTTLELIVTPGWDGRANDVADWADAQVTCVSSDPPPVNNPPVVALTAPAAGSQFTTGAAVVLSAVASDDGAVARVEFYRGSTLIGTASAAPWSVQWTGALTGSWVLTARAYDNLGASTVSAGVPISVVAGAAGLPPAVALTNPEAGSHFPPGSPIPLTAVPFDPEGQIAKVEFFSGTTKLGEVAQAPWVLAWTPATAANHVLSAKATDRAGGVAISDSVPVIVAVGPNRSPSVTMTASVTGTQVVFTADASDTGGGSVKKVEFYQGSTKLGEDLPAPYSFTWSNVALGSYLLTARAVDNEDASGWSAPVAVQVMPKRRVPPVVWLTVPVTAATYPAASTIPLRAEASDADGSVVKVEFYRFGVKIGESRTAPYQTSWVNATAGVWTLTARAYDNSGEITASAAVDIGVNVAAARAPAVEWAMPSTGMQVLTAPGSLTLAANAFDPNGVVRKVEFFRDGVKLGEDVAAPYVFPWTGIAAGSYVVTARATDDKGYTGMSTPLVVQVNPPPKAQAPVVSLTAPVDQTWAFAGSTIVLRAEAGALAGSIARVEFWRGALKLGQSLTAPFAYPWTNIPVGRWEITARAYDSNGNVGIGASANIVVTATLNRLPLVSLTAAADGSPATAPASIEIVAAASDGDGSVRKVEFYSGTVKLGESSVAPFRYVWTGVGAGSYVLTARATDSAGAIVTSAPVRVVVGAAGP